MSSDNENDNISEQKQTRKSSGSKSKDEHHKELIGVFELPTSSEWNESMSDIEKMKLVDSILQKVTERIKQDPDE
tara:strand:+ start:286 stop:510 length:225 start_codon:yes stop_codon:yes gene_type:complete